MAAFDLRTPGGMPYVVVLGIAQDAGYPAPGCRNSCCARAWTDLSLKQHTCCLGLVDPQSDERWLLDCAPDFPEQLHMLDQLAPVDDSPGIAGILLTHAHIGHYAGLIHLGREALDTYALPVYAMPRMRSFLETNEPWRQFVTSRNIEIHDLGDDCQLQLNPRIAVKPFLVPHRDELSETVGLRIQGPSKSVAYVPDINGWNQWERAVEELIADVDVAYLDGTFYSHDELPGRSMAEIPHPSITESIERFSSLPAEERGKVRFLHLNHTNPVLNPASEAAQAVANAGHHIAHEGELFAL